MLEVTDLVESYKRLRELWQTPPCQQHVCQHIPLHVDTREQIGANRGLIIQKRCVDPNKNVMVWLA